MSRQECALYATLYLMLCFGFMVAAMAWKSAGVLVFSVVAGVLGIFFWRRAVQK